MRRKHKNRSHSVNEYRNVGLVLTNWLVANEFPCLIRLVSF
jgi:hypothetical protein